MTETRATYRPFKCPVCGCTRRNENLPGQICYNCGEVVKRPKEAQK